MLSQWLQQQLDHLLLQLEPLSKEQEEDIQILCQQEIDSWRSRPSIRKKSSLSTLLMGARTVIRERLPIQENNSWFNPKRAEWEHLALKYLNFSEAEWLEVHQSRVDPLKGARSQGYVLSQPEAITQKAAMLLTSSLWPEIIVGLTLSTGRSFLQILKTGQFQDKTTYSLLFSAPYRRQDRIFVPREIPTLTTSSLALEGVSRLRRMLDCSSLVAQEINRSYRPAVRTAAYQHFLPLIPIHPGTDDVYMQLARAIYPCLATYYYCPSSIEDLMFMATIQGHYWVLEAPSPEHQRALAQAAHYFDYHLDPAIAQKGIRLTEPQVNILETFKREEFSVTIYPTTIQQPITAPSACSVNDQETGAVFHLRPQTLQRCQEVAHELELDPHEHDTLMSVLLNIYTKYCQLSFAERAHLYDDGQPEKSQTLEESHLPHETTEEPMLEEPAHYEAPNRESFTVSIPPSHPEDGINLIWTHFQFSDALKQLISQALASCQDHDFRTFLQRALEKEAQALLAQARQQQHDNFSQYTTSQLAKLEHPLAIQEHIRRAVYTILQHNVQAEPANRWYIHARVLQQLTGRESSPIHDYLRAHQTEITHHHTSYGLSLANNRKVHSIEETIHLAEVAEAFPPQGLLLSHLATTEAQS